MRLSQFFPFLLVFVAGCATQSKELLPAAGRSFPPNGLITQRAVLTARGRQFTLNGYLSISATGGKRLVVMENFGSVLADVLVKPDGHVRVMRSSPALRRKWIERYVAADLQCIFGNASQRRCPGRMLSPTHIVIERFWYKLDLQIVEIKPGPQPAAMFDETATTTP